MKTNNDHATYIEKPLTRLTGKRATGFIAFTKNPSSGSKITIDGVDYVFGNDIVIGLDVYETVNNIMLIDTHPTNVLLFVRNNKLELTAVTTGSVGNSITFSTDVDGSFVSGFTLTNGVDIDNKKWKNDDNSTVRHIPPEVNFILNKENAVEELLTNDDVKEGDKVYVTTEKGTVEETVASVINVTRNTSVSKDVVALNMGSVTDQDLNIVDTDFATQYDTNISFGHRVYNASVVDVKNNIYIIGGNDTVANGRAPFTDIFSIDKTEGAPISGVTLYSNLPYALTKSVSYVGKDRFYLLGGEDINGATDNIIVCYLDKNGDITSIVVSFMKMPGLLARHSVVVIGNLLYLFGGSNGGNINNTVYVTSLYEDGTIVGNWSVHSHSEMKLTGGNVVKTNKYIYYFASGDESINIARAEYDPETFHLYNFETLSEVLPIGRYSSGLLQTKNNIYLFGGTIPGVAWDDSVITAPIHKNGTIGSFREIEYKAPAGYSSVVIFSSDNYIYFTRAGLYAMQFSDMWPEVGNDHRPNKEYKKFTLSNTTDLNSVTDIHRKSDIRLSISHGDSEKRAETGLDKFITLEPLGANRKIFYVHDRIVKNDKLFIDATYNKVVDSTMPKIGSVSNVLKNNKELASFGFENTVVNNGGSLSLTPTDVDNVMYYDNGRVWFIRTPDGVSLTSNIDGNEFTALSGRVLLTDTDGVEISNNEKNFLCYVKIYAKDIENDIVGMDIQLQDTTNDTYTYLLEHESDLGYPINTDAGSEIFFYIEFGTNGVSKIQIESDLQNTFAPTLQGELCTNFFFGTLQIGNSVSGRTSVNNVLGSLRLFKESLEDSEIDELHKEAFIVRECVFENDIIDHTFACKKYIKEIEVLDNASTTEKRIKYYEDKYVKTGDTLLLGDEESIVTNVEETIISQNPFTTFNYPVKYYSCEEYMNPAVISTTDPLNWESDATISGFCGLISNFTVVNNYVYAMGCFTNKAEPYKTPISRATINPDGTLTDFEYYKDYYSNETYGSSVKMGSYIYIMATRSWIEGWKTAIGRYKIEDNGELGDYEVVGELPIALSISKAVVIKDIIYLIGGTSSAGKTKYVIKITENGTKADLIGSLSFNASYHELVLTKTRLYIMGDCWQNSGGYCELDADGNLGPWTYLSNILPEPMCRFSLAVTGNNVYLFGGNTGASIYSNVVYKSVIDENGVLGQFLPIGNLSDTIGYHSTVVTNNYIYLLDGKNGDGNIAAMRTAWTDGWLLGNVDNSVESSVIEATITHEEALSVKPDTLFVNKNIIPLFDYEVKIKQESTNILSATTVDPHDWVYDTTVSLTMFNLTRSISVKNKVYYIHARTSDGQGDIFVSTVNSNGTISKPAFYRSIEPNEVRSSIISDDKYIYIIGGDDSGVYSAKIYRMEILEDGNLGACELSGNLPVPLHSPAIVNINNNIYVFGGFNSSGSVESIIKISNHGAIAEVIGSVVGMTRYHELILTRSKIYIIGGRSNVIYRASIRDDGTFTKFTVDENTFPFDMSLTTPIVTANAAYVIGGSDSSSGNVFDTIYKADIDNAGRMGNFYQVDTLPTTISNYALVVTKNRIYLLNGRDTNGDYVEPLVATWEDGWQGYQTDTTMVSELKSFGIKNDIVEAELIDSTYDGNVFINTYGPTNVTDHSTQRKITICEKDVEILEPIITGISIVEN